MKQTVLGRMLIGLILTAISVSAHAGWSGWGVVTTVYSHNGIYVVDTAITNNPCGWVGRFWWPQADPDAKDMYAMALTAFAAGKRIAVVYDETSPNCNFTGALATYMQITN